MENINIEPSPKTPKVVFDQSQGVFEIEGRSIPENSTEFYQPVYSYLDSYSESPSGEMNFQFKLEYFNTSSSKCIFDILRKLEKIHENGGNVNVTWFYEEDDEDMQEAGEDYQRIVKVPITIEAMEEE